VARPAQGQLPASSPREIDDRRAWPARHLAVNRLDRADQLGLDVEGVRCGDPDPRYPQDLVLRSANGGWYSGYPNRTATMSPWLPSTCGG
jgi:hypothetical protein